MVGTGRPSREQAQELVKELGSDIVDTAPILRCLVTKRSPWAVEGQAGLHGTTVIQN